MGRLIRRPVTLSRLNGIANVASPIRWIDRPGGRPGRHPVPAPEVGEHTDEVFAEWLGDG